MRRFRNVLPAGGFLFVGAIFAVLSVISCYTTHKTKEYLPDSLEANQPQDVPIPREFQLVHEPGAAYEYQEGSFRWASARYQGNLSVDETATRMKDSMGIHGWVFSVEETLPGHLPGRRLEFKRDRQKAIIQIFLEDIGTVLQVDVRTVTPEQG